MASFRHPSQRSKLLGGWYQVCDSSFGTCTLLVPGGLYKKPGVNLCVFMISYCVIVKVVSCCTYTSERPLRKLHSSCRALRTERQKCKPRANTANLFHTVAGVLMDKYGAKSVMVVSFAASAAVYGMTAAATSMTLLYASSFPALLQHGVLAARVWISNACGPEQRAAWLGYIGLAYSLGMVCLHCHCAICLQFQSDCTVAALQIYCHHAYQFTVQHGTQLQTVRMYSLHVWMHGTGCMVQEHNTFKKTLYTLAAVQVTGPAVGGFVGDSGGPRAPAYLAAWGSVASTLSLVLFLPGASYGSFL